MQFALQVKMAIKGYRIPMSNSDKEMRRYIDPSTHRKSQILHNQMQLHQGSPIFSMVEMNMLGRCNRTCEFCPISDPNFYDQIDKKAKFSPDLYRKFLHDLSEIGFKGLIVYSGLSEPLLLKKLEGYISDTKSLLPEARLEVITNGDALSEKRMTSLFEAGLDTLLISMYDGSEQISHFTEMGNAVGLTDEQFVLRRRYFEDGNYGLTISNRGGLVNSNEFRDEQEEEVVQLPLNKPCYYPFYMIKVDYDGDVTMCSHDWEGKMVLGNINKQTLWEIWQSETLATVKKSLVNKKQEFFSM